MGEIGTPHLIIKGAASPHTYALKPSDAAALQKAELILRVGKGFETFLNSTLSQTSLKSAVIDLAVSPGIDILPFRTGPKWAGGHDHGHDHGTSGKNKTIDPHIWLSPANAIAITKVIEAELIRMTPSSAAIIKRNATTAIKQLQALKVDIQNRLATVRSAPYLVYHDAFQYFEQSFGLTSRGSVALSDNRAPGARRIRALQARLRNEKIVCIFTEPQFPPKLTRTLTAGTNIRVASLDPIGAALPAGPDAYAALMKLNANAIADCLGKR
jgi:zinc transport system substrate-binding protein